jgi:hypothetical protein
MEFSIILEAQLAQPTAANEFQLFHDCVDQALLANHAYGTVKDAIGYVERLVDAGADEIMFLMQMGTVPQKAILETLRNIGEQVIPHFRDEHS